MTQDMQTAHKSLRDNAEVWTADENGIKWGEVYLDNAKPKGWAPRKWAAVLGALKKAGLYRDFDDGQNDGVFGIVNMGDA